MPRTPEVCSNVFTPFSQFSNGSCGHLNVLPLRRSNAAFSRRIFFWHNKHPFFRQLLTAACLLILLITYQSSLLTGSAQSATATLSGTVTDQNNAVVPNVNIAVINIAQGFERSATTNDDGAFVIPLLPPGAYIVKAEREGFTTAEVRDVVLNVNDQRHLKIPLKVGGVDQTVNIVDTSPLINESPAVGTLVDRQFVGNLPLNGRSFQSLITLTPGVVLTKTNVVRQGQFSVNGQRADANYFMVDGVSANIGAAGGTTTPTASGSLPGLTAFGGTNNLVSVDALQEFKIQTSSVAPEFGRTPGAQISIVTRAGTNEFHGMLFDYFRNDVLDANDWFGNRQGLKRPAVRQNDFGGVLGGPLVKNRLFFFFSYEGLRLRQPATVPNTPVPSLVSRQAAPPSVQPLVDVFPKPNGPELTNGLATFSSGISNPSRLNATSIRLDGVVRNNLTFFGRYNYAPSETSQRAVSGLALNNVLHTQSNTQTLTLGTTQHVTATINNEIRFNYSRNTNESYFTLDDFGGAVVPADSVFFPSGSSSEDGRFILQAGTALLQLGKNTRNVQRQLNLIDNFSVVWNNHQLKFGFDYRLLYPILDPPAYQQTLIFSGVGTPVSAPSGTILSGRASQVRVSSQKSPLAPVFNNFSAYAQDTWKITPRLTLTYGFRWEVVPPPHEADGNDPLTLTQIDNPSAFNFAPPGTPLWKTTYGNLAPRIGISYRLFDKNGKETIVRGGFGLFYDLGSGQASPAFVASFPFIAAKTVIGPTFPLSQSNAAAPSAGTNPTSSDFFYAFDPDLLLPRVYQWNAAVEHSFGPNQSLTSSYVAAIGRRLLKGQRLQNPGPFLGFFNIIENEATSDYHALQVRFQRRFSRGLQSLFSYTWAHSIDNASTEGFAAPDVIAKPDQDRGPSNFDVRHAFNGAISYDIPTPGLGKVGSKILSNWSLDSIIAARSATPVDITYVRVTPAGTFSFRPDLVSGVPLYLSDPTVGGGIRFNPAAFAIPSTVRQGTLGRNALEGFGMWQVDFALRRQFNLAERFKLQFRAEFFNAFNHPNFADPAGNLGTVFSGTFRSSPLFGVSASMLGTSLGTGGLTGGFNPLYQVGGSRSIQLSLKLHF